MVETYLSSRHPKAFTTDFVTLDIYSALEQSQLIEMLPNRQPMMVTPDHMVAHPAAEADKVSE